MQRRVLRRNWGWGPDTGRDPLTLHVQAPSAQVGALTACPCICTLGPSHTAVGPGPGLGHAGDQAGTTPCHDATSYSRPARCRAPGPTRGTVRRTPPPLPPSCPPSTRCLEAPRGHRSSAATADLAMLPTPCISLWHHRRLLPSIQAMTLPSHRPPRVYNANLSTQARHTHLDAEGLQPQISSGHGRHTAVAVPARWMAVRARQDGRWVSHGDWPWGWPKRY